MMKLATARASGVAAMNAVAENSGPDFQFVAYEFAKKFIRRKLRATSEEITTAALEKGIVPHDFRAFGPVYQRLQRDGVMRAIGTAKRRFGHGTQGGTIWERT